MERFNVLQGTHKTTVDENSSLQVSIETTVDRLKQLEAANRKSKAELIAYSE